MPAGGCPPAGSSGISAGFPTLSPSPRQIAHVLLTRSPLRNEGASPLVRSLDLHVLSTPPAFILSQDQTLHRGLIPPTVRPKPDGRKSLISIARRYLGARSCVVPDRRSLARSDRSVFEPFRVSLAMQFSRRRKNRTPPRFSRLESGRVLHRPWGRQGDSIALARGKATGPNAYGCAGRGERQQA